MRERMSALRGLKRQETGGMSATEKRKNGMQMQKLVAKMLRNQI